MKQFEETIMYKKGHLAESIMDQILLTTTDFIPYAPAGGIAHPFDRLVASKDKKSLFVLELKAVSARNFYPDTGISIQHYKDYLHIQVKYRLKVFIAFVDSKNKEIYGNTIESLAKPTEIEHTMPNGRKKVLHYPKEEDNFTAVGGRIIYFPLQNMKRNIFILTTEQAQELEQTSNYGYSQDLSHKKGYQEWKEAVANVARADAEGGLQ